MNIVLMGVLEVLKRYWMIPVALLCFTSYTAWQRYSGASTVIADVKEQAAKIKNKANLDSEEMADITCQIHKQLAEVNADLLANQKWLDQIASENQTKGNTNDEIKNCAAVRVDAASLDGLR